MVQQYQWEMPAALRTDFEITGTTGSDGGGRLGRRFDGTFGGLLSQPPGVEACRES